MLKRGGAHLATENTLFGKKFIGSPVEVGTSADRYQEFLMDGEVVKMEFKGMLDALVFTDHGIGDHGDQRWGRK